MGLRREPAAAGTAIRALRDNSIVAMAVSDIEDATAALKARGITPGPIEPESDAGLKAVVSDPDANSIAIIEVPSAS